MPSNGTLVLLLCLSVDVSTSPVFRRLSGKTAQSNPCLANSIFLAASPALNPPLETQTL